MATFLKKIAGGFRIQIKVQPGASASRIEKIEGDYLKIRLQAPAHEGRANWALIDLLKKTFRVPKSRLSIVEGEKNRYKIVQLATELSEVDLLKILGI